MDENGELGYQLGLIGQELTVSNTLNTISDVITINTDTIDGEWRILGHSKSTVMSFILMDDKVPEFLIQGIMSVPELESEIDYDMLITCRKLTEYFIEIIYDKINKKNLIYQKQYVGIKFIEKHVADLGKDDWDTISMYSPITEDFIKKYQDKINWKYLASSSRIEFNLDFLLNNLDAFDKADAIGALSENFNISDKLFNDFVRSLTFELRQKINWRRVSWARDLSEDIIFDNLDEIDFYSYKLKEREFENVDIFAFRQIKYGF